MRDLAQHITDLFENSVRARARRVTIEIDQQQMTDTLMLRVTDDGCGMPPEVIARVTDPFFTSRTYRRVGLGLPLLEASARRCDGRLVVESEAGRGTVVEATFRLSHIDIPPLGDLGTTLICAVVGHPELEVLYRHAIDGRVFELDSAAIRSGLGGVSLSHPFVIRWLERHISEGLVSTGAIAPREEEADA